MTVPRHQYLSPSGRLVSSTTARRMLRRLSLDLRRAECRDRARYISDNWRRIAARPSLWLEFQGFAARHAA
jgi:hypothetical protein